MSNTIPTTNISIRDDLHIKWTEANGHELVNKSASSSPYTMGDLRGALFTDGTTIVASGPINISDIKGKHFAQKFNTGSFRVYDNWSAYPTKLKGTTGTSTYTGSTTANKRVKLYSGQSTSYPYPIILLTPNASSSSTSPGIIVDRTNSNVVDEVTVWFRVVSHNSYNAVQLGIVAKDMTLDNWTSQISYLHDKHGAYCDRLGFAGYGYHNYAGSRDDITSSSTVVSPQYKTGTYGSSLTTNFHNRTGTTAGTMRSFNAASSPTGGTSMYFFKNSYANYNTYRGASLNPNHGLKVKWYEKTIQVKLVSGSNIIEPVSGNWSVANLTDIFSGMYVSGTGITSTAGAFIGDIHTNYMKLYKSTGTTGLTDLDSTTTTSSTTLTISGYLYWTLTTASDSSGSNTNYTNAKIFGPPHTVLPKYQAASSGSTTSVEIKEWAFYIGDTTTTTSNYLDYDLRDTDPTGTPFTYAVTYTSGTIPSTAVYEFAINVGGTYAIAGSLSSITPASSGYAFTTQQSSNIAWSQYSMGARIQFLVAGKVVALGVQNRYGGYISIFPDASDTAAAGPVSVAGTGSTSTSRNYKYTTLSTPLSVAANSIYRTSFTNSSNGYSYHNISAYYNTNTSSGSIKLLGGAYRYMGNTNTPYRPTSSSTTWNYGSTDLIFLPD